MPPSTNRGCKLTRHTRHTSFPSHWTSTDSTAQQAESYDELRAGQQVVLGLFVCDCCSCVVVDCD